MPHQYDVAAKVLIDSCRNEILRYFIGIDIDQSLHLEELPQETVSLKRSDYPILVTDTQGVQHLVILEIQTEWNRNVPLNLLDYRARYMIRHECKAVCCVVLLRPSAAASDFYEDNELKFRYRLVKIYELDADTVINRGPLCILPFIPLMKGGKRLAKSADTMIYNSDLPRIQKADMLTSMAILSGLVSKEMPADLIARRRDIMTESTAYDIIKKEGIAEGRKEGILEGILQGILDPLYVLIEVKFGVGGAKLYGMIDDIKDPNLLRNIVRLVRVAKTPDEVAEFIKNRS